MFQHVNLDVLANWVLMLRADVDGAILLSDNNDEASFYERCAHEKARVIPAHDVALLLLRRMDERGVQGVVATFRGAEPLQNIPNAFRPTLGDIASLLLVSKSCDSVVRDLCGNAWLTACEKEVGSVLRRVAWISRVSRSLRQAGARELVKDSDNLEILENINWSTFELDWDRITLKLLVRGFSQGTLKQAREMRPGTDLRSDLLESDGMESVCLFAAATRLYRPRGIASSREVDPANFMAMLRVAFDLNEFGDYELFWRMKRWEFANSRYPLLGQWRALDPLGIVSDQRYWEPDLSAILKILKIGEPIAMFKIDLDNFKQVNDTLGHAIGDQAIRVYCKILKNVFAEAGEVYRRGGDEVVVLAPGLPEESARALAEKARVDVESEFRYWAYAYDLGLAPTASVGLVLSDSEGTPAEIIMLADSALQRAKQQGKNTVVVLAD